MWISIKKLNEIEFEKTMIPPMQSIGIDDESSGVNLKKYVTKILNKEKLQTTVESIEIEFIYQSADQIYEHVLFDYGHDERYLVIVVLIEKRKILGYHLLNLAQKYGINSSINR